MPSRQRIVLKTSDGWRLQLEAFCPGRPRYPWPWLCIHGFSQSHLTWTAGGFAQELAALGCPVYVLDLRGHGGSALEAQGPELPEDARRGWDMNAYLLQDLQAALAYVKSQHPNTPAILCGHSMGGILAVAQAILFGQRELAALVLVAAPLDPTCMAQRIQWAGRALLGALPLTRRLGLGVQRLPMAEFFSMLDLLYHGSGAGPLLARIAPFDRHQAIPRVWTPAHMDYETLRKMLQRSYPEPLGVVQDFMAWIRSGAIVLGRQRRDITRAFDHVTLPLIGAWGEADLLAPPRAGATFREAARSSYARYLSLPQANHIDITAGTPAKAILEAIEALLKELARASREGLQSPK